MVSCSRCGKETVTFIRYSGAHLCKKHFNIFFLKRIRKEIRWQVDIRQKKNIAVAVSGGKDSAAVLWSLKEILGKNPEIRLTAVTVDEGVEGYRPPSISAASKLCEMIDVPHEIISFAEVVGLTMDETSRVAEPLTPCSYCGVWRKKCLNQRALELGADVLATGHNLDDMAQSIAMNVFNGDVKRLIRMGPHRRVLPGLVPRIMPLRTIPEKETYLWAYLNDIPFKDSVCPYAATAHRGLFREIINKIEKNTPGTRHRLLGSYDEIYECMAGKDKPGELNRCKRCDQPTSGETCKACEMEIGVKERLLEIEESL